MLLELHNILRRLLYERGQISEQEVDIQFEAPTQEHIERLWRPAINLFLYNIHENTELRQNNYQSVRGNGRAEWRPAPRRFNLRYMVSALSSEIEDEAQLCWRVLATLVRYPQIPVELLPEEVRALDIPLVTKLGEDDESQHLLSLWNALGVRPRPALAYTVTVPVELASMSEAPLVLTRTVRYTRLSPGEQAVETGIQVGGVVRNQSGETLAGVSVAIAGRASESITDVEGRFVLRNMPANQATLHITPATGVSRLLTLAYPAPRPGQATTNTPSYEIVLDTLPPVGT